MFKFLIVDDDAACRRLLQHFLYPYADCDLAYDGHEAIAATRIALESGKPYDLILLDIMMPGADGHQTLDAIRQIEHDRGVRGNDGAKVLMTTALRDSDHCIRAFREGCEAFVTKPVSESRLLAEVEALLGYLPPAARPKDASPALASRTTVKPSSRDVACPSPETERPQGECDERRRRFLIVDDDRVCRELLKDILTPHGDCDLAYDGREAVDAVRLALDDGHPYDLLCLDIMMPQMSGHEALQAVRQLEADRGIFGSDGVKVVMTTALSDSKHCLQSFREGCEGYVTKPIDEPNLLAKLAELGVPLTCSATA